MKIEITREDIYQMHKELEMPKTARGVSGLFTKFTRMGATIPEIAGMAEMTVERVKLVIAGKSDVTHREHRLMMAAFGIYLWWNSWRRKQKWAYHPQEIESVYLESKRYWSELCSYLREDLEEAYRSLHEDDENRKGRF